MSVPIAPEVSRLPTDPDQHWPVGSALLSARLLVERGWLQGAFLAVTGPAGHWREVGPLDLGWYRPGDVVAGCLLGAVAYGSWGGAGRSRRLVHRMAVDHAWTVWARDSGRVVPERLRFGPADRALRLQDLTAWNDAPGRTANEVSDLLAEAALAADAGARAVLAPPRFRDHRGELIHPWSRLASGWSPGGTAGWSGERTRAG